MNHDPKNPLEDKGDLPWDEEIELENEDDWEGEWPTLEDFENGTPTHFTSRRKIEIEDEWEDEEIEDRSTDEFKHYVADKRMDEKRDDRMIKD